MIFVTYEELNIQPQVHSTSDKSIVKVLFTLNLTVFTFNSFQEFLNDTSILFNVFMHLSADHSPVHLSL